MDILIPNLELPLEGRIQLSIYPNGLVVNHSTLDVNNRRKAVALPSHGDLIDRDALIKDSWASYMLKKKNDDSSRAQYDTLMGYEIRCLLEDAPTIVEASTPTNNLSYVTEKTVKENIDNGTDN